MADLDPEDARAIIDPALRIMVRAVRSYEGYVVQSTGDGIYAVFGAPIAYEDHPQRGRLCGARDAEEAARACRPARETWVSRQSRCGLESIAAKWSCARSKPGEGSSIPRSGTRPISPPGSRRLAPDGSIAVSERTRRLVEGYFELRPLGTATVKGISDPIEAYEVTGLGTLRRFQVSKQRGLNKFVGRDGELQRMRRPLERAMRGEGQIVASVSDAGTGKSRLLFEFSKTLPPECKVLEAHSMSHGKAMAWLPVIELLLQLFRHHGRGRRGREAPKSQRLLGRARPGSGRLAAVSPGIARRRRGARPPGNDGPADQAPANARGDQANHPGRESSGSRL